MMPGVPNASMARQVEQAGFEAVYVSGAGMANSTAGVPDIGLLSMDEVVRLAGYVARAVRIPAIVDADTGFGEGEAVAQTIRALEKAGLAGCHIEDQEFPKRCGHLAGKTIVDVGMMVERIKTAVAARRDKDFLIIARTDARAVEGFDRAVERAGEYLAAGADAIFPEALQSADEFRDFAKEIEAPLMANMTEFGKEPAPFVQRALRFRLSNGDFPAERVPGCDESERRILARVEKGRHAERIGSTRCRRGRSSTSCWTTTRRRKNGQVFATDHLSNGVSLLT